MCKGKTLPFIETMCILPCEPRSDFNLNDITLFCNALDFISELLANAKSTYALIHIQLLDFPNFPSVVQQVLDVQAQEPERLAVGESQQVNDIGIIEVLVENPPLRGFIQNSILKQVDEIVDDCKVVGSRQTDRNGCQKVRV